MNRFIFSFLLVLTGLSTGCAQQVPVANKQPSTLGRLLQSKQQANPSFRFSYDQPSKIYYVPDQVILSFPAGTQKDEMTNWVKFYNDYALKNKQSVKLSLLDHVERTGKALMGLTPVKAGNKKADLISLFYATLQESMLGVNPPKPVPGPKPPIIPTDFSKSKILNEYKVNPKGEIQTAFEGY